MKNLFEAATLEEVKERIAQLRPDTERQWGTMTPAQVVAHCAAGMEVALGDRPPQRLFLGRMIGQIIKPLALRDNEPMRRNSPTTKDLIIHDQRNLELEQQRLRALMDRFASSGPAGFTKRQHSFFGPMTPMEWSILMYKHLDHHLRQFGV